MAKVHPERVDQAIQLVNTGAFGFFGVKMTDRAVRGDRRRRFPIIAWQAYAFIAPGLYKRERTAVAPFLLAAPIMFALGGAFVFYVAMPFALEFALSQEVMRDGGAGELPAEGGRISRPGDDAGAGVWALLPDCRWCLSLLARVGMINATMLRKGRRYAVVGSPPSQRSSRRPTLSP